MGKKDDTKDARKPESETLGERPADAGLACEAEPAGDALSGARARRSFRKFAKRYWYWFVVIGLLILTSVAWLASLGVFDTSDDFNLDGEIYVRPLSYYSLRKHFRKYEIKYELAEADKGKAEIADGNILHHIYGESFEIKASVRGKTGTIRATSGPTTLYWGVKKGGSISAEKLSGLVRSIYSGGTISVMNSDKFCENEETKRYEAKAEGSATVVFSRPEEASPDGKVDVCQLLVGIGPAESEPEHSDFPDLGIPRETLEKMSEREEKSSGLKLKEVNCEVPLLEYISEFASEGAVFVQSSDECDEIKIAGKGASPRLRCVLPGTRKIYFVTAKDGEIRDFKWIEATAEAPSLSLRDNPEVGDVLELETIRSEYNLYSGIDVEFRAGEGVKKVERPAEDGVNKTGFEITSAPARIEGYYRDKLVIALVAERSDEESEEPSE